MKEPSNLPPGVTDNDSERQAGAFDEDMVKCARCGKQDWREDVHRILGCLYCESCADIVLGSDEP